MKTTDPNTILMLNRTTNIVVALFVTLAFTSIAYTQQATQPATASKLVEVKIPAPSLKGNVLGDPTEQTVGIYLPPSYESSPARRFPTLYLLHGFTANNKAWTNGYQGKGVQPMMDELIRSGNAREMIVVMPSAWNTYKGSFYTNSAVTGNWEDYMYRDLVQYVDTNYRTINAAQSRGIVGHSMGGYGAMTLAMKHPDVFGAVYALSPCCFGIEADFGPDNPAWLQTVRLTQKEQLKDRPSSFEEFYQIAFIAVSAAFSPNPERKPFYVEFPFQERNGKLEKNETVFARWQAKMPLYMIDEHKQDLLKLRGIFIDYGEKEEFSHIRITSQRFSKELAERNIPHEFEIYAGGTHGNKIQERLEKRVFRFFSEKLDFGP